MAVSLVLCFMAATASFASDPNLGTWKLSEAKSRFSATAVKNYTVVYQVEGTNVRTTVDAIDPQGQPTHNEWTGKFDGQDYPIAGDPAATTRSNTKRSMTALTQFANKKNGKIILRGRIVISTDGKSRTVTAAGTTANGEKIKFTAVYDKE